MIRIGTLGLALALLAAPAGAEMLFHESFDYGTTTASLESVSAWKSGKAQLKYDHDGGLAQAGMADASGGAAWYDAAGWWGAEHAVSFDTFAEDQPGGEIWMASIIQWNSDYVLSTRVTLTSTLSTNDVGFGIGPGGSVIVKASDNGLGSAEIDTGMDVCSGQVVLLLLRAVAGGGENPTDSVAELWVTPGEISDFSALGPAQWTTGADSAFGSSGGTYNSLGMYMTGQSRVDEIRVGQTLSDLIIPEPTSLAVLTVGLVGLTARRRGSCQA